MRVGCAGCTNKQPQVSAGHDLRSDQGRGHKVPAPGPGPAPGTNIGHQVGTE